MHMGSDHWVAMSVYPSLQEVFDLVKALVLTKAFMTQLKTLVDDPS